MSVSLAAIHRAWVSFASSFFSHFSMNCFIRPIVLYMFSFISNRSSHPQILTFVSQLTCLKNGEGSSSSATRPTTTSHEPSELSEEQKQTVERCTNIVQEFQTGAISKPKASWMLQQAIPHEGIDEDQFLSSYKPYFNMLDNFERYQTSNVSRIEDVHQRLASPHGGKPAVADNRSDSGDVAGLIK